MMRVLVIQKLSIEEKNKTLYTLSQHTEWLQDELDDTYNIAAPESVVMPALRGGLRGPDA